MKPIFISGDAIQSKIYPDYHGFLRLSSGKPYHVISNTHACTHMPLCVSEILWLCFSEQYLALNVTSLLGCTLL